MKLQLITAIACAGVLVAQDDPKKPEPQPPRPPGEELPFPPPRPNAGPRDGERPAPRDGERPRDDERPQRDPNFQPNRPQRYGERLLRPEAGIANRPMKLQPFLGLVSRPAPPELAKQLKQTEGFCLVVEDVLEDGPAKTAGIVAHDVLVKLDDQLLVNPAQLEALVRRAGKDKEVALTLLREGAEQKVTVKVGEKMMPERRPMQFAPQNPGGEFRPNPDGQPRPQQPPRDSDAAEPPPRGEFRIEGAGGDRSIRYNPERARIVRRDDAGTYTIEHIEGRRIFTFAKPDGSVVWKGATDTDEERKAMPEEARKKFAEIERERPVERARPAGREPQR